jgi:methylmalonyl-CoA mutase cobalamin-binding subunit
MAINHLIYNERIKSRRDEMIIGLDGHKKSWKLLNQSLSESGFSG